MPSEGSSESGSSVVYPGTDCAEKAYLRLSAIYGFDPLPPPPPFSPRATTSAEEPVPRLEGGIIMAARRIQAALCIDKQAKSSWGIPVSSNCEDDNKPIPGWTDGSNAWRPSVYGLAPPRDFTRSDPDDAAIRAYGSYIASPHRSRSVQCTSGKNNPAIKVQIVTSPSLPENAEDASTQELYRQYCQSTAWRSQSRTLPNRGAGFSTSPTCLTRYSPREVPLLKHGAEGRLLVPNVKMRRLKSPSPGADSSFRKSDSLSVGGPHCAPSHNRDEEPNAERSQNYKSEKLTYSIMRLTPKKEQRVERRVIDGVEHVVHVEVLVEEPIKRLFLFGGARD
ncbi:hypothetical protein GSI_08774 [Ganoderma sinense ZZ0214-1]|uniref:Uncharacterized protein n=1 Tax=Ganoderma sinense ZZ0214-1 TaxID=1077348 RepID=A0A2G8S4N3_9APHY|nr:hypothetical protein GSI_08774 [Ganoderma sinense ZZ0214-1]